MRHIIPDRSAEFPETFKSLWLAGPDTGLESCGILISRCPPGHHGPRLHTHPVDQFYFVIEGETTVQIGTDVLKVPPMSLVRFPAGVPHCNWNETAEYERHLEVFAPAPPKDNVLSYHEGPVPTVPDVAGLVRRVLPDAWPARNFAPQHLAMRAWGSPHCRIYAARVNPGGHGPALHFHDFDQVYFILKGALQVQVGHVVERAEAGSLVVLPRGVVHTNWNADDAEEIHLTLLVPEPDEGVQFDYKVEVKYENAPAFA